jgi:SAM-dependent methyltransferase
MRILDAGCGFRKYQGNDGDTVIGLDYINKTADITHNLNKFPYPFKDNEFDMVWCNQVLEHLDNPIKVVEELWRITKPGGKVLINVPHYSSSMAYNHIGHLHCFGSGSLAPFDIKNEEKVSEVARFKVKSRIRWLVAPTHSRNPVISNFTKIVSAPVDFFVNLNFYTKLFAERFLCYALGGFDVVEYELEVLK